MSHYYIPIQKSYIYCCKHKLDPLVFIHGNKRTSNRINPPKPPGSLITKWTCESSRSTMMAAPSARLTPCHATGFVRKQEGKRKKKKKLSSQLLPQPLAGEQTQKNLASLKPSQPGKSQTSQFICKVAGDERDCGSSHLV